MKTLLSLLFTVAVTIPALASSQLEFVSGGQPVQLAPDDEKRVTGKIEDIVASANFNSRDNAKMFTKADQAYRRPLAQIRKGSFLLVRYDKPHEFETVGGKIAATEVWVDLREEPTAQGGAVYPGPITLIQDDETIRITKEGGYLLLGLGLDHALYPHLPEIIRETMDRGRKSYEDYQKQK